MSAYVHISYIHGSYTNPYIPTHTQHLIGDFCMDPVAAVLTFVSNPQVQGGIKYYLECSSDGGLLTLFDTPFRRRRTLQHYPYSTHTTTSAHTINSVYTTTSSYFTTSSNSGNSNAVVSNPGNSISSQIQGVSSLLYGSDGYAGKMATYISQNGLSGQCLTDIQNQVCIYEYSRYMCIVICTYLYKVYVYVYPI